MKLDAQQSLWSSVPTQLREAKGKRYILPEKYITLHFDSEGFRNIFMKPNVNFQNHELAVPMPNGDFITFSIHETPVFDEELMKKYPGYTSYTGTNQDGDRLKMSISPYGIHAMILSNKYGHIFIDPYTLHDHQDIYQIYNKTDYRKKKGNFTCSILSSNDHLELNDVKNEALNTLGERYTGDCQLRSYRLAISCTGEYAAFHGGTREKVLAAYNNTMTRVNGVYERDAGITMKLIGDTDKIIYLNGNTDPFTNGDGEIMLDENQATIDDVIGRNNYDIGHVFSTGGGGIAQLRSPCSSSKAMGVTGQTTPVGDPFDIDYVAHEMGHQFGGNHTQNNSCQRSNQAAMEPGSASTIMGYAGICEPNVQNNSDGYFHGHSIFEISNFVVAGNGNTCATIIPEINSRPSVSVSKNEYTIPKSTSFALTALAQDLDGDQVTYCWEQMNNTVATMPPVSSNTGGPAFRSVNPSTSPTRYFPDLLKKYGQWEVLPSVARDMNFRCTIRDNHQRLGCTDEVDVKVKVSAQAGPFNVTYPNTLSVNWMTGSKQTVTWDVASTNNAPINCQNVNIYLSTDGGSTYPILLVENVINNGSGEIIVPGIPTTKAKVMVKAADNIFFDVSNVNFKITSSFEIDVENESFILCDETKLTNSITITKVQDSTIPIILSVSNPFTEINYDFSQNPIELIPENIDLTISDLQLLSKGWHKVIVNANRNLENLTASFDIFMGYKGSNTINALQPEKNKYDVPQNNIVFVWEEIAGIKDYTFELSISPAFTSITHAATLTTSNYKLNLEPGKVYYWRVKPNTPCKILPYSQISSFRTKGTNEGTATILFNEALLVNKSSEAVVDSTLLSVIGENRDFITFTLIKLPTQGDLLLQNSIMKLGDVFTMSDIVSDRLKYKHNGGSVDFDNFNFNLLDDKGRWLPDVSFVIRIKQGNLGLVAYRDNFIKCFGDNNGIIHGEGYGGILPYTYALDGINFQSISVFPDLSSGNYIIYIKDAVGAVAQSNMITLEEPAEILAQISLNKYNIIVNASGGTGILNYSIDGTNFQTEPIFSDPGNGLHLIYVKDESGCSIVDEINIFVPPMSVKGEIKTNIICANQSGVINLTAEGGFQPYTFSVDGINFQANPSFTVTPGRYIFHIKDSGGKISLSDTISTNLPTPIDVQLVQNKFEITINATGGTGSLKYSTNNINFNDNNIVTFSDNGSYKIYVRDSLLCSKVTSIVLNVLKTINVTSKDISCHNKNDGYIKLLPSNGAQPFKYSLNGSDFSNNREWSGLSAGIYNYIVKDNKNDSLTGFINIKNPDSLEMTFLIEGKDLEIVVKGGTPPYVHSIDNGLLFLDTNKFTDLEEIKYDVQVKDKNGCLITGAALLTSTQDTDTNPIKTYPNPVQSKLYIQTLGHSLTGSNITLKDITGRPHLFNYIIANDLTQIDMQTLPSGLYIIEITSQYRKFTNLIVKE